MILLSANNANTTLAAGISSSTTTIVMATGTGALFPSPGTNQYFPLTLNDALTGLVYEICWCTSRTGDNLTVLRGQEGTTARAWLLGDYAYNANTAGNIQTGRAFSAANNPTLPFTVPATHNGITQICAATGTITLPAVSGIVDGFLCPIVCNSSGATITVNTNSAAVSLPTGNTSTTFTLSGLDSYIVLQWNLAETMWNTVSASPSFYYVTGTLLNVQTFTSSGTYTPTPGTHSVVVEVQGGGGGGGGCPSTSSSQQAQAGGGQCGAYGKSRYTSGFSGVSVTVGAAGSGGATGSNPGNSGGTSSFGSLLTAPGGSGGAAGVASPTTTQAAPPTAGSAPTGANLISKISVSGPGFVVLGLGAGQVLGGGGGSSPLGDGGPPATGTGGNAGTGFGAGGGGCSQYASEAGSPGGNGTAGVVIVWEYT